MKIAEYYWDEPVGAVTPRGWYRPLCTSRPGQPICAGYYADYGPEHFRLAADRAEQPGNILCAVLAKLSGTVRASRYVETAEAARQWIETESQRPGGLR